MSAPTIMTLYNACLSGDVDRVKELCHQNPRLFNVHCLRTIGISVYPFAAACKSDSVTLVQWFLNTSTEHNVPLTSCDNYDLFDFLNYCTQHSSLKVYDYLSEQLNKHSDKEFCNHYIINGKQSIDRLENIYQFLKNKTKISLLWNDQIIQKLLIHGRFISILWLYHNKFHAFPENYSAKNILQDMAILQLNYSNDQAISFSYFYC